VKLLHHVGLKNKIKISVDGSMRLDDGEDAKENLMRVNFKDIIV
jgi:hypothetical protein